MEKQFSQKWMATVTGTSNNPVLCLRQDAASSGTTTVFGTTLVSTQNLGTTRQNSGDLSLSGAVAGCPVSTLLSLSTRACAFVATASGTSLHSVR
jgi:hypothetical protein